MVLRKCTICDRRFKKTEHFKRHERSHTNERPYECNVCHKRFSRSDVLSRHAKGHNNQTPTATNGTSKNKQPSVSSDQDHIRRPSTLPGDTPAALDDGQRLLPSIGMENVHPMQPMPVTPRDMSLSAAAGIPPSSLDFLANISAHHARTPTDMNPMMMDDRQAYFAWNEVAQADQNTGRGVMFDTPMPNDMLQMWLEPRGDSISHNGSLDIMQDPNFGLVGENLGISPEREDKHSVDNAKSGGPIPNERFAKVQRYWVAPASNTGRLMNSLWRDMACSDVDNIFTLPLVHQFNIQSGSPEGSRYGLDEECKRNLQAAFFTSGPVPGSFPNFPPAEILDMALDLYFRNFHPLVPIVHLPTFYAKKTRLPMLYVMCLIGMMMLETKGTTNFVFMNFSFVLEKVTAQLARCSVGVEDSLGTMCTFATTFLFLNLAAMTGEKGHLEKCQMLYVNLISIAQRHGLFAATEGQLLDMSLFEAVPDIDMRWKAWSKIESAKSEALFRADCSMRWMQLIRSGKRILMPTLVAPSENTPMPPLDFPADDFCIHGVLAMVQLRLSEAYHRLLSNRASYPFAPCHTYAMDGRARCLPSLQVQIISQYGESLERLNPNAIVMWHNMCMMLTADIQIFNFAAGRAGPNPARKALHDISSWSQTPAARRACLHAAHIYRAMTDRKTSDNTMFHSVFSLFSAALVLGLYTFMVPNSTEPHIGGSSIELLNDIDWTEVETEGFTNFMEPRGSHAFTLTGNPAVNFIRNGGTVYLRGVPFQGGYQSARRILLDYASLLKDAGKWSVRKYSYVLHIMSDVLMDVE
ncbi:hypothetical protein MW887_010364 [Aspergillus wentii]|nr:hypothetical protein MW887_010364 [Aspergillus wentii]